MKQALSKQYSIASSDLRALRERGPEMKVYFLVVGCFGCGGRVDKHMVCLEGFHYQYSITASSQEYVSLHGSMGVATKLQVKHFS